MPENVNQMFPPEEMKTEALIQEPETYPMPTGGWVCFHCGEQLTTPGAARDHFGARPGTTTACQIKVGAERGLLKELRKSEASKADWMERALQAEQRIEDLEYQVEGQVAEIRSYKPFLKCRSINDVFFLYDNMEGRALAAEERLKQYESKRSAAEEPVI